MRGNTVAEAKEGYAKIIIPQPGSISNKDPKQRLPHNVKVRIVNFWDSIGFTPLYIVCTIICALTNSLIHS